MSKHHRKLYLEVIEGKFGGLTQSKIGCKDFAKESEHVEFIYRDYMAPAVKEIDWNPNIILYRERDLHYTPFDAYYNEIKNSTHTLSILEKCMGKSHS